MFISVDLPAPFSPRSACTSPWRMSSETSSLARTPGNSFRIPRISRTSPSEAIQCDPKDRRGRTRSPPSLGCNRLTERRRDLELPGDDVRPIGGNELEPRRRNDRGDPAEADAAVLPGEDEIGPALERPVRRSED